MGYEQNQAEFPVVLGNLFHLRDAQGAIYTTAGNHFKGLQTAVITTGALGAQKRGA